MVAASDPNADRPEPAQRAVNIEANPLVDALAQRTRDVRQLSEELAESLRGGGVEIEGLPEGFPVTVQVLLEAGARELMELGVEIDKMILGDTYESRDERIYRASYGEREDGFYLVQVSENRKTGRLNLMIGLLIEKGEGRGKHAVSATLNYENHVPVIVDASTVELAVTYNEQTIRADFSAKKKSLNGYAGAGRESKAEDVLFGYFPDREYSFSKAFRIMRELTRKTYGRQGKE